MTCGGRDGGGDWTDIFGFVSGLLDLKRNNINRRLEHLLGSKRLLY